MRLLYAVRGQLTKRKILYAKRLSTTLYLLHAQMHPERNDIRYIATSGALANDTKKLLLAAAQKIRALGGKVVLGLDNDRAGRTMTEELCKLLKTNIVRVPSTKDWSEDLADRQRRQQDFCLAR